MSTTTEDSFWEGFVIGVGLPGSGMLYEFFGGTAPPDRYHWEVDEDVWGHYPVLHLESQDDQAYWAGYLSGFGVGTAGVAAFIAYAGAELGLYSSVGFGLGQVGLVATPIMVPAAALTMLAASLVATQSSFDAVDATIQAGPYWAATGDVGSGGSMPVVQADFGSDDPFGFKAWWESL